MLNNNFKQLVRKYERYRGSKIKKIVFSVLALIALLVFGFYAVYNSKKIVQTFKEPPVEKAVQKKIQIEKQQEEDIAPTRVEVETPKDEKLPNEVYKRNTKDISNKNKFKLEVKERKNLYKLLTDDKELESYQSAVEVAKFYYEEKNHDRTITWSVKASKRDPRQSLPWILYAKSKVSQGKVEVAKKALTIYLKHTEAKEVRDLYNSL